MGKLASIFLVLACVAASTAASAREQAPLGSGNFAVKLDYIVFTDSHFGSDGNENDGLYFGLEGYGNIADNLYLGGEIGAAANMEFGGDAVSFVPVELNVKYAAEMSPRVVFDAGGGLCYASVEIQYSTLFGSAGPKRSDDIFGAQAFVDLTFKFDTVTFGLNGKYQVTQEFNNEGIDLNNYRLGLQLGFRF